MGPRAWAGSEQPLKCIFSAAKQDGSRLIPALHFNVPDRLYRAPGRPVGGSEVIEEGRLILD